MAPLTKTLETALQEKAGAHFPVVDGVQAAIEQAIGMTRMNLRV